MPEAPSTGAASVSPVAGTPVNATARVASSATDSRGRDVERVVTVRT
jgi:hypothetical protein